MRATLAVTVFIAATPALSDMDRGRYLVETVMGCGNCHTPIGPDGFIMDAALSGRLVDDNEAFTAIAPNITAAGRIVGWTDAELARAIREGIRPDGSLIGPPMPFAAYKSISDDDLASVVSFLRSVPPVEGDPGASVYHIPLPPAYGPAITEPVSAPAPGLSVEYGGYLTSLAHCMECHSPAGPTGPDWGEGFARGGFEFLGPWGTSISSNLTNHPDGLAGYSDAEITTMLSGIRPDGSRMLPPMPYQYLAAMADVDKQAIVLYLRSLTGQPDP